MVRLNGVTYGLSSVTRMNLPKSCQLHCVDIAEKGDAHRAVDSGGRVVAKDLSARLHGGAGVVASDGEVRVRGVKLRDPCNILKTK